MIDVHISGSVSEVRAQMAELLGVDKPGFISPPSSSSEKKADSGEKKSPKKDAEPTKATSAAPAAVATESNLELAKSKIAPLIAKIGKDAYKALFTSLFAPLDKVSALSEDQRVVFIAKADEATK